MWPTLRSGDFVHWETLQRPPRRGDVLVFRGAQALVVHRVISTQPLRLRGDNCLASDPPLTGDAILGRVVAVERAGKRLSRWDLGPSRVRRLQLQLKSLLARGRHALHA